METKLYKSDLQQAAEVLKHKGLIAVPTETVYGIAANGFDEAAVKKIYDVKGRPSNKPISLMVSGTEMIDELCIDVPKAARFLAENYWPGALTIVLKANKKIPNIVRADGETVGLRCPDQKQTLSLLEKIGFPLAAPSANPSDLDSAKSVEQVMDYFNGKIEGIIDGGRCSLGTESTIIDLSQTPYKILREGAIPSEDIFALLVSSMTIIGITGGTGCGKTTALDTLKNMGGLVIDCDEVYHTLLNTCKPMQEEINLRFPNAIDIENPDTKALGEIVFNNPDALRDLNSITHKYVGSETTRRMFEWAKNGGEIVAIDAIALFESGISDYCKCTVGITAPTEERINRLMKRENISHDYAHLRVSAQKPNEYFKEICDYTLSNDSTIEMFEKKSRELFNKIIKIN